MSRFTVVLATIIALFVIEGAVVAAVLVSPDARDGLGRLSQDVADLWIGTEDAQGLFSRYSDKAKESVSRWVLPIWRRPAPESAVPTEFSECAACHQGYWDKVRSSDLYFNHPQHAQVGLACGTCHTDTTHPSPLAPPERVCADCHTEVGAEGECQFCHVPGSLPHYYDFAIPRGGYVDCGTCHLQDSFVSDGGHHQISTGRFDGSQTTECAQCHDISKCQRCHGVDHSGLWVQNHGDDVDTGGANNCATCHTEGFCSDACHAGVRPGSRPLPIGGTSG